MSSFRAIDRQTSFLLPPSVDEWLSEKRLATLIISDVGMTGRVAASRPATVGPIVRARAQ